MKRACILILMFLQINSATARTLPAGAAIIPAGAIDKLELAGSQMQLGKIEHLNVTRPLFSRALRASTVSGAATEWNVQLVTKSTAAIKSGDVVLIRFWMRCEESMTSEGLAGVVFEEAQAPFDKAAEMRIATGAQWTECFVPFQATQDFPAGKSHLCFRLGYDRQTIDLADVTVTNYGSSVKLAEMPRSHLTYAGRAPDSPWRAEAADRIEKNRKGDLTIHVTDAAGKPIAGAKVHAALKRHAFGFGSCVTAELLTGNSPDAEKYREFVEQNFNLAVFENDMKWPAVYDGFPPQTDQALDWLRERNIDVRGHNLIWPSYRWLPSQLKQYQTNPAELRKRVSAHVSDTVSHYKRKLFEWDVVNEPYSNHDLMDALGRDVLIDWYKLARAADPDCKLYLNDFGVLEGPATNEHRQHFYDTIKYLKDSGAPIDGIGIQSHFSAALPSPRQLMTILNQFSEFGLPIQSTELSLNIEDSDVQSDYMRDYMTVLFSHPNVKGVMLWGFWEGRHWRPRAALYARDWTPRPVAQAWLDLVQKQWRTDVELTTDDKGIARVRGFCGDYSIDIASGQTAASSKVSLSKQGAQLDVVLK